MYANVVLDVNTKLEAIAVPVQALLQNGDRASVLVVDQENRIRVRDVKTGVQDPNLVEIVAGLKEGERVIVGNLGAYQPGEIVQPKASVISERGTD
jgi:membrane fusion protein (multidrug efflux system)